MPKKLKKKCIDNHDRNSDYRKHKRMKRKQSSSGRSSKSPEPSSSSIMRVIKDLEQRRLEEQSERKKLKNEIKMKETPEEKRARRLKEKKAKELRRRERMGWDIEYQHYTNQDNPFGDSNLMSTFVWNKKLEKEGLTNVSAETVEVLSRQKQLENKVELEKVKKRRIERESERQAREDEMVLQQRSKEAAQFKEWEKQEDQFHLEQARLRSIIRIQDGRAKPIDLLAQYVSCSKLEDSIEMQMHEPYILLNGLSTKDLEDLLVDIKVYVELEKGCNIEFWDDMTLIVEDELLKKKKVESIESCMLAGGRRQGINESVARDVSDIFRGKNTVQLNELGNRIEQKINARNDGVDISYWESLLSQLKAHMARARLRDHHQANLQQKLTMLKTMSISEDPSHYDTANHFSQSLQRKIEAEDLETAVDKKESDSAISNIDGSFRLYDESGYSPLYFEPSDLDESVKIINENQDEQYLDRLRAQLIEKMNEESSVSREELEMHYEAKKGMLADEAEFSVEAPIDTTLQLVSDKYRPRKPRYFNRVHTGFEWNKYNQTHYDMDNPPPKIVQGYKFNIFYPDLINKSATPQYILTQCSDNSDFAILRFHAGPPYEDIAFKIVNREWEFSYKRGFRCQFHNNIFQLWFHFKRYRYRR